MNLTIDNRTIHIDKPVTVLDAALHHGINIPSLCAHPDLTPYGGCRLCIVEIEGKAGYPTSCTTMAEDGMIIRTDTHILKEMRREMIQLILSEHPAACLMCDDIDGCSVFQETIRKVGVTTGCRWCPKDKDCELQRIVEQLDIKELTLPGLYRDFPLEKYDPFFDRDYNLCIYCGRCVRICHEHRKSSVLSLKQRGKMTSIGPAFDTTHIEADCEFCGACVSVCPTGAMSEKSRKWWGAPERYESSVCPLCSLNCDLQVLLLRSKIVGTIPPGKPHESGGELCVKGRFCLSELLNRTERILEPQYLYPEGYGIVSWNDALERASKIIENAKPGRSAIWLSPSLTMEEMQASVYFAEQILHTQWITSSCFDENLAAYVYFAQKSVATNEINKAGAITSFFLNGNYNFAPLTIAIKAAATRGIPYYQIGWINDTTSRFAHSKLIPDPLQETQLLDRIIKYLETGQCKVPEVKHLSDTLKNSKNNIIIIGPQIMSLNSCPGLLEQIHQIAVLTESHLLMPNPFGNLGGLISLRDLKPMEAVDQNIKDGKIDLLYLLGDTAFRERPPVQHIIYQNTFAAPPGLNPDVILPTSLWGEEGGSYCDTSGKVKKAPSLATPHGYVRSHIACLSAIAGIVKKEEIAFPLPQIVDKLSLKIQWKQTGKTNAPVKKADSSQAGKFPFVLIQERNPHVYSHLNLGLGITALGELVKPGCVMLHPGDAKNLKLKNGDQVNLMTPEKEKKVNVVIRKNIPRGYMYLTTTNNTLEFKNNPCYVNIIKEHV
jgi:predicted molibdopterin-dependent oxidoreductase YjgC